MKRKMLFIPAALFAMIASFMPRAMSGAYAASEYENPPESGVVAADSYFGNAWYQDVGTRRIDERSLIATVRSDWGYRGNFLNRTYDATSFDLTLDLSQLLPKTGVMLIFGSNAGSYATEATRQLVMDIIVGEAVPGSYIVTCSTPGLLHNNSIPEFTDGGTWADDANFQGVQVATDDFRLHLSINRLNEAVSEITVNEKVTTVSNSALYAGFENPSISYVSLGLFNNAGTFQSFIIESIGDKSDDVYYGKDGDFTAVKTKSTELTTVDLSTTEHVFDAKLQLDELTTVYNRLYAHDRAFLSSLYDQASTRINEAVETAGNELAAALFVEKVTALTTACGVLNSVVTIDNAIVAKNDAAAVLETINVEELTGSILEDFIAAKLQYEGAAALIITSMEIVLEETVSIYEQKVLTLTSVSEMSQAMEARNNVPTKYYSYLEETKAVAYANRMVDADLKYNDTVRIDHSNWVQGMNAAVVENSNHGMDILTHGTPFTSPEESNGVFCQETLSASDFEVKLNVNMPQATGAWVSFGLMEKPEMWIYADNDSVQNNKGIFFLLTYINSETLGVQAFLCSLTSNRFYDSPLTQNITMPMSEEVTVKFFEETTEIAGVTETYFRMTFNGVGFDQENVTAKKIKTVLGTKKEGYFFLASSGFTSAGYGQVSMSSINGKSPFAESLRKESAKPSSTDTEKTFTLGETTDVSYNLTATKVNAVKVNNVILDASTYSFANGTLTLKNAYLSTLSAGEYNVTAECEGGNITWRLKVEKATKPTKKGCGGSIIATSSIVSFFSLAGFSFLLLKKKKQD